MSNLALYRKYRSQDFDELVGQAHVVKALSAAIKDGNYSHAYLLTGPRGVGKTTVARIIAKRINGLKKADAIKDYVDIIEIDGASNRGIDEMRGLKEKIQIAPARLSHKVYIIDEVHMLTKEAFNALLKTLEEPPAHVVFIFATTEANKLPETIISRTQRFDFRPIPAGLMVDHLNAIAKKEGIKTDKESLELISRISRGGFRDAISLLDQLSSIDKSINKQLITDFTGLQDQSTIDEIIQLAISKDTNNLISTLQGLYDSGADPNLLTQQILDNIHDLIRGDSNYSTESLVELVENLHWVQFNIRSSSVPQLTLQVGLIRNNSIKENQKTIIIDNSKSGILEKPKSSKAEVSALQKITKKKSNIDSSANEDKLIKALSLIKKHNNSLYALLRGADLEVVDDSVNIKCRFNFHKDRVMESQNRSLIQKAFSKVFDKEMIITVKTDDGNKKIAADKDDELLKSAVAILGGSVIDG